MKHKYAMLSIIAILLVSGCAQLQNFFGQDVLTINRKVSEEGFRDIIAVKNAQSIPKSPVLPGQSVLFSFIIENVDASEKADKVVADMFNIPLFKDPQQQKLCNQFTNLCQPDICRKDRPCSVLPGEQRSINFELLAPTENEIARIKTDTELSYKVSYNFRGNLLYTVPAVNQDEIRSLQRQGKSVSLTEQVTHGSGPVQIDVQLFGTPYLLSRFSGTFIFNIKNKGKGNIVNSKIDTDKFTIIFPLELFGDGAKLITPDKIEYDLSGAESRGALETAFRAVTGDITGFAHELGVGKWRICKNSQGNLYCYDRSCDASDTLVAGTYDALSDCVRDTENYLPATPSQQQTSKWNICKNRDIGYYCEPGECASGDESRGVSYDTASECGLAVGALIQSSSQPTSAPSEQQEGPLFKCAFEGGKTAAEIGVIRCTNKKPIELFRDETRTTLRFEVKNTAKISEPFKTYLIRASVDYSYELRDSFPITVRPFEK